MADNEDPEVLAAIAKATQDLKELLKQYGLEVDYVEADWRDTESLINESHRLSLKHPGWPLQYISGAAFGIDANYVFFVSKPVDEGLVLKIAGLVVDDGAELPEELPLAKCPKCGKGIDCLVGSYPASIPARATIINDELQIDWLDSVRVGDLVDSDPETWHCPHCDEVLFSIADEDYMDKMDTFLKGGK